MSKFTLWREMVTKDKEGTAMNPTHRNTGTIG